MRYGSECLPNCLFGDLVESIQFEDNCMFNVDDVATNAKRDLAWLAAVHQGIKQFQGQAGEIAKSLLAWPELVLREPVDDRPPTELRAAWERTVGDFAYLRSSAVKPPRDNPGHYLNKAAVVYAVSILEDFLPKAFEAAFGKNELEGKASLDKQIAFIQGATPTNFALCDSGAAAKLEKGATKYVKDFEDLARHVLFMAQQRHVIVHNYGEVNNRFLEMCGIEPNTGRLKSGAKQLWDSAVWRDEAAFLENNPMGGDLDLTINSVIVPYIRHAVEFVDEAVEALKQAAGEFLRLTKGRGVPGT